MDRTFVQVADHAPYQGPGTAEPHGRSCEDPMAAFLGLTSFRDE